MHPILIKKISFIGRDHTDYSFSVEKLKPYHSKNNWSRVDIIILYLLSVFDFVFVLYSRASHKLEMVELDIAHLNLYM